MRWSQAFIPTLREPPADAESASHILLLRAGYVRQLAAGIYSYLFLGQRSLLKIVAIVRQEMDRIGQEFLLPALHPAELWQASGRWQTMGDNLFRLKDRFSRDLCLGMTHEENMASIAAGELRSYKQLPQIWYQIQTKFRDEPRPRGGLLRVRQFLMKDSYSFDLDDAGLDASYQKHHDAYCRIFDRCGLRYLTVEAHSGAMGGSQSQEFMAISPAGEDWIASCRNCAYAANLEKAEAAVPSPLADEHDASPESFPTPGQRSIEEVARFTGLPASQLLKSLLYLAPVALGNGELDWQPRLLLVRGDDEVNETKLAALWPDARPAHPAELEQFTGAAAGSIGPVNLRDARVRVFADLALRGRRNLVAGANREGYHLRGLTPGRDFQPEWVEVRQVRPGDACKNCGQPLAVQPAIEIGHIFKLGRKYSQTLNVRVLDEHGREAVPIMGSYGIGMERILTAAIEQNHDEQGFWLPSAIAPFQAVVSIVNTGDPAMLQAGERIYAALAQLGVDVLLDDRHERPGVKFKDADLIGIPWRITVGKKIAQHEVELQERRRPGVETLPADQAPADLARRLQNNG